MFTMSVPESRARLGYLLSEMLSLPYLPEDLHQAVTAHLQQQLSTVNLFKPEYCLRLYPVLAELAELETKSANGFVNGHAESVAEVAPETEHSVAEIAAEPVAESAAEAVEETPVESTPEEVASETEETPVESVSEEVASETEETPVENVSEEVVSETEETPETFAGMMPVAAAAEAAANSRTLW